MTLEQKLNDEGQKITRPRRLVFKLLERHHPTSIEQLVAKTTDQVDRASIYRTLNLFRELGIVQDIIHGGRKMIELTDRFDPHHHHIFCVNCHETISVDDGALEQYLTRLAAQAGFELTAHQLEMSGVCADCLVKD